MANERLARARDLIKAKQYQEARQVLKVIADHPTARTWLAKLDAIAPEVADDPFAYAAPLRPTITPLADIKSGKVPPGARPKRKSRRLLLIALTEIKPAASLRALARVDRRVSRRALALAL